MSEKTKGLKNVIPSTFDVVRIHRASELRLISNRKKRDAIYKVLIINALREERQAALEAFDVKEEIPSIQEEYQFPYTSTLWNGIDIKFVLQPSMGPMSCCCSAMKAIKAFEPDLVVMTGVCAGRKEKEITLGSVVVSEQTYDFFAGKYTETGFLPRPEPIRVDQLILSSLKSYSNSIKNNVENAVNARMCLNDIQYHLNLHFAPLASSSAVISNPKIIQQAAQGQDNLIAIDMETFALAAAATSYNIKWLVVKGVQDFADGEKSETEKNYRKVSCLASAYALREFLKVIASNKE